VSIPINRPTGIKGSIVWTLAAFLSFVAGVSMPYFEGRSNSIWAIPPMLPAGILPLLLHLIACIALLGRAVRSLRSKQHRLATFGLCFASIFLFVLFLKIPHRKLYQRGFSEYAKIAMTSDEWRNLSRFAQGRLKEGEPLWGPGKSLGTETDKALWSEFVAATEIRKLPSSLMIFVTPDETTIEWGGALVGHRYVRIFTHPSEPLPELTYIADDIAVGLEED
jgi:hypothetical protein